jgi:hypothetical protein
MHWQGGKDWLLPFRREREVGREMSDGKANYLCVLCVQQCLRTCVMLCQCCANAMQRQKKGKMQMHESRPAAVLSRVNVLESYPYEVSTSPYVYLHLRGRCQ